MGKMYNTSTHKLLFNGTACANCLKTPDWVPGAHDGIGERLDVQSLIPCRKCNRVWFCNEECAKEATEHNMLCSSIAAIPSKLGKAPSRVKGPEGWKARYESKSLIDALSRAWRCPKVAFDAFAYGRHCVVCNRTGPDLKPCRVCLWDWSCPEHHDSGQRPNELVHTKEICDRYQVFNALALRNPTHTGQPVMPSHLHPSRPALPALDSAALQGWPVFLQWYFGGTSASDIERSEATSDASRPLTVVHYLQKCGLWVPSARLLVHVVGAGGFDFQFQGAMWRLIIQHIVPRAHLRLVFVGDEITSDGPMKPWPHSPDGLWSAEFVNMSYENYQKEKTESPDFVVAFNAGVHRPEYTWSHAVELLMELNVPVMVTCRTGEHLKEMVALRSLGVHVHEEAMSNPFMSHVPRLRPGFKSLIEVDNQSFIVFIGREETPLPIGTASLECKGYVCATASRSDFKAGEIESVGELREVDQQIELSQRKRRRIANRQSPLVPSQPPHAPVPAVQSRVVRRSWTDEETMALREAFKQYGPKWEAIRRSLPDTLGRRTAVQLKDKWRNLCQAGMNGDCRVSSSSKSSSICNSVRPTGVKR